MSDETLNFRDMLKDLSVPFEKPELKSREGAWDQKNNCRIYYDYIEWNSAIHRLNSVYPRWEGKITKKDFIYENGLLIAISITYAITIDGVTREGEGTQVLDRYKEGDSAGAPKFLTDLDIKGAESDALKRAAIKFGVALHIKDNKTFSQSQPNSQPGRVTSRGEFNAKVNNYNANNPAPSSKAATPPITAKSVQAPQPITRWEDCVIHFGRNVNKKLSELDGEALLWYTQNYQPKPYNGKINPKDQALRDWLDTIEFEEEGVV